jgi:hypothetical protein
MRNYGPFKALFVSHMDIHQKKMEARMKAERKVDQEEMLAEVDAIQEKMDANREARKTMDLEANREEKESGAVHEEVPKEHASVKPVGGQEVAWGEHLAAGHRSQPEEGAQGNCGIWKKLVAAHGRMTCHAGMACHKGHGLQGQSKDNVLLKF